MTAKKLTLQELEACAAESGRKLIRTFPEMRLAFLQECSMRRINRAYALRDYYPFWKTNAERSKAGKLLLLNRQDEDHIQIMFDDNIGYGSPHIVDARDARTGQPVSFKVKLPLIFHCLLLTFGVSFGWCLSSDMQKCIAIDKHAVCLLISLTCVLCLGTAAMSLLSVESDLIAGTAGSQQQAPGQSRASQRHP